MKFGVMGIVPPDSMPVNKPQASGFFADHDHAVAYGREFVLDGHHNNFECGLH